MNRCLQSDVVACFFVLLAIAFTVIDTVTGIIPEDQRFV